MKVAVLVEISHFNIDKTFDYSVSEELMPYIKKGIRVRVPFNTQILEGFVLDFNYENDTELKSIIDIIDEEPILNEELIELGSFISDKYYSTKIAAYQTMLPKALKAQNKTNINKKYDVYLELCEDNYKKIKLNESQKKIVDCLIENRKVKKEVLNTISKSSIKTSINKNIIKEIYEETYRLKDKDYNEFNDFDLNDEQEMAVNEILKDNDPMCYLLHGVTGSGKTIIYLKIIENMLKSNKDSILLVPEISLTPQMVMHLKSRFKDEVSVLHSRLSDTEKYDEYRKIVQGKTHIVVGARSAIFAPFKNLGVIIIDEEHTQSYKQENNPKYNAIEIALQRSKYHKCKVILGSATPSLETYAKSLKGIYKLIELKKRANNKGLPEVKLIDMNKVQKKDIFSKDLIDKINEKLSLNEQIILLLNRRGYSSFITCSSCNYVEKCPNCDISLTYHKTSNMLRCHYCGYAKKFIEICPACHEKTMKNLGIGTEKVEEELNKMFNARIIRMDLDTTSKKGAHERIIEDFKNNKYDILLGTQMIAKGLDFPNVTLVGIINADTSLMIPNYRSSEYTYQLLSQTSGRAGRDSKKGEVIVQTYNPEHYAIVYAKDNNYRDFFNYEMSIRRSLEYPPYFYLAYIKVIGKDYDLLSKESNKIGLYLRQNLSNSKILGPCTCSVFKVNNQYRFGIILKYKKEDNLNECLNYLIEHYKSNNKIKIDIDINPYNI